MSRGFVKPVSFEPRHRLATALVGGDAMERLTGTLEDREEIRELYARYAHAIDEAQFEQWVDCFTEDGVFESPRFGRHAGREGLRRFTVIYKESLGGAKPLHHITNVIFSVSGEEATGGCYLAYYHCKDGIAALSAVAHYIDRLRKVDGQWRFSSRQVALDGRNPA
jgi:3-phenylpropionate/cinnamic acid dioxygenase small subunit